MAHFLGQARAMQIVWVWVEHGTSLGLGLSRACHLIWVKAEQNLTLYFDRNRAELGTLFESEQSRAEQSMAPYWDRGGGKNMARFLGQGGAWHFTAVRVVKSIAPYLGHSRAWYLIWVKVE